MQARVLKKDGLDYCILEFSFDGKYSCIDLHEDLNFYGLGIALVHMVKGLKDLHFLKEKDDKLKD